MHLQLKIKRSERRTNDEQQFFEGLIAHMDTLRAHLEQMPQKRGGDGDEEQQLILQAKAKFAEIERRRANWMAKLVEKAQQIRDGDILGLLDDPTEGRKHNQREEKSRNEAEPPDDSSEERRKPRRVSTYHGTVDQKQKSAF